MRIIITGGSGFIGSHVRQHLQKCGHDLLNIDRAGDALNIDICDADTMIAEFGKFRPDFVFHIAAVADARTCLQDPVRSVQINAGGTAAVFEAARRCSAKRVVLASTCWVANAMRDGVVEETEPFLPTGGSHIYTTTKIASEMLAHDFNRLYGLHFTILRYGIPYGPGMWPGLVLRSFLDNASTGKPLTIFGDGSASRKFVFVDDLARAHALAMNHVAQDQTYNLEGMRFVTIKELAEVFSRMWGGVEVVYMQEPTRIGEFQYFRKLISSNKAYIEMGWEPRIDLEEGIRRTIEWYRHHEK